MSAPPPSPRSRCLPADVWRGRAPARPRAARPTSPPPPHPTPPNPRARRHTGVYVDGRGGFRTAGMVAYIDWPGPGFPVLKKKVRCACW